MTVSLHEEYIRRHRLGVPVVVFKTRSTAFLYSCSNSPVWRILTFQWIDLYRHPGFYEVTYTEAIHNGYSEKRLVNYIYNSKIVYWDQYEKFVLDTVQELKGGGFRATESEEAILAVWEIFLIMYDSWLARNMDSTFFCLVEQSTKKSASVESRIKACALAQKFLAIDSHVENVWTFQLLPLARYGAEWLTRLIND